MQSLWVPDRVRDGGEDADIIDIMDDEVVIGLVGEVGAVNRGEKTLQDSGAECIT